MSAHSELVNQMREHRGVDPHAVLDGTQESNRATRRAAKKSVGKRVSPGSADSQTGDDHE